MFASACGIHSPTAARNVETSWILILCVGAHIKLLFLDPGPLGPIDSALGRSGPFVGPQAIQAHLGLDMSQGEGGLLCPVPKRGAYVTRPKKVGM